MLSLASRDRIGQQIQPAPATAARKPSTSGGQPGRPPLGPAVRPGRERDPGQQDRHTQPPQPDPAGGHVADPVVELVQVLGLGGELLAGDRSGCEMNGAGIFLTSKASTPTPTSAGKG